MMLHYLHKILIHIEFLQFFHFFRHSPESSIPRVPSQVTEVFEKSGYCEVGTELDSLKPKFRAGDLETFTNEMTCNGSNVPVRVECDLKLIEGNGWLTDVEMKVASDLLRTKNSKIGGLQDPILGQANQWQHPSGEFIQFLHVNGSHWLTISNIGEPKGVVNIYDSLLMKPSAETLNKIAQFVKSGTLTVKVKSVQRQVNSYDCGIFAIAFGTSLLHDEDPSKLIYKGIRPHLLRCIQTGNLTPFPSTPHNHGGIVWTDTAVG